MPAFPAGTAHDVVSRRPTAPRERSSRAGWPTSSMFLRATVPSLRHDADLERHHLGHWRWQLRRRPADAAPADGRLSAEGQVRPLLRPSALPGDFADVPCPSTFANWIEALAAEGISGGCGGGNFCPSNPVRGDQMAPFLLKARHGSSYVPPVCTGLFDDVPCPSLFVDFIEQLDGEQSRAGAAAEPLYCPLSTPPAARWPCSSSKGSIAMRSP